MFDILFKEAQNNTAPLELRVYFLETLDDVENLFELVRQDSKVYQAYKDIKSDDIRAEETYAVVEKAHTMGIPYSKVVEAKYFFARLNLSGYAEMMKKIIEESSLSFELLLNKNMLTELKHKSVKPSKA
jgi:hypothetical protein